MLFVKGAIGFPDGEDQVEQFAHAVAQGDIATQAAGMARPALRMAFSTETTSPRSQTLTVSERGSGTLTLPTWVIGVVAP